MLVERLRQQEEKAPPPSRPRPKYRIILPLTAAVHPYPVRSIREIGIAKLTDMRRESYA
jgi:hypothetical protein